MRTLAHALKLVLRKWNSVLDLPAYNTRHPTSPVSGDEEHYYHWTSDHAEADQRWRLGVGTGFYINPSPEEGRKFRAKLR